MLSPHVVKQVDSQCIRQATAGVLRARNDGRKESPCQIGRSNIFASYQAVEGSSLSRGDQRQKDIWKCCIRASVWQDCIPVLLSKIWILSCGSLGGPLVEEIGGER